MPKLANVKPLPKRSSEHPMKRKDSVKSFSFTKPTTLFDNSPFLPAEDKTEVSASTPGRKRHSHSKVTSTMHHSNKSFGAKSADKLTDQTPQQTARFREKSFEKEAPMS